MKNHVNYETSVRLKEAGFPQPEPEFGQVWWLDDDNPSPLVITFVYSTGQVDFCLEGGPTNMGHHLFPNMVFAPTAADILRELGFRFYLIYDETASKWFLNKPDSEFDIWDADNPAEAAAQAFLNLKAKP